MIFHIYMIFNTVNGKLYIGKTNDLHNRWITHKRVAKGGKEKYPTVFHAIHSAIVKYGADKFDFCLIQSFSNEDEAYLAETYWITYYNSKNVKFGYNETVGGLGSGSGINSANYGLKRKPETIIKLRESHLGERNQNFGQKFFDKIRKNMSAAQKGKQLGEKHANSVLTWADVEKIRSMYENDEANQAELAILFNTHRSNISHIVNYKTWTQK